MALDVTYTYVYVYSMSRMMDARIPVFFAEARDDSVNTGWLVEDVAVAPWAAAEAGHVLGCACCVARSPVAEALGRLFRARATGEVAFFTRLGIVPGDAAGEQAVRAALVNDGLASACYRLEP
jgi:hypothetical protein